MEVFRRPKTPRRAYRRQKENWPTCQTSHQGGNNVRSGICQRKLPQPTRGRRRKRRSGARQFRPSNIYIYIYIYICIYIYIYIYYYYIHKLPRPRNELKAQFKLLGQTQPCVNGNVMLQASKHPKQRPSSSIHSDDIRTMSSTLPSPLHATSGTNHRREALGPHAGPSSQRSFQL